MNAPEALARDALILGTTNVANSETQVTDDGTEIIHAVQTVFIIAAPIATLTLALILLLKEVRRWCRGGAC